MNDVVVLEVCDGAREEKMVDEKRHKAVTHILFEFVAYRFGITTNPCNGTAETNIQASRFETRTSAESNNYNHYPPLRLSPVLS